MSHLRKHLSTFLTAAAVSAIIVSVTTGGSALATHVGTVFYRRGADVTVFAGGTAFAQVKCPNVATRVIGGGFYADGYDTYLNSEWPASNSSVVDREGTRFWAMYFVNPGPDDENVTPYAICVHGGANFGGAGLSSVGVKAR